MPGILVWIPWNQTWTLMLTCTLIWFLHLLLIPSSRTSLSSFTSFLSFIASWWPSTLSVLVSTKTVCVCVCVCSFVLLYHSSVRSAVCLSVTQLS